MKSLFKSFKKHHWVLIAIIGVPLWIAMTIGGIWALISVCLFDLLMVVAVDAWDRDRSIYILVGISTPQKRVSTKGNEYLTRDHRTFGYYGYEFEAKEAALRNAGDINEAGYHEFLVVEEVPHQGVYPLLKVVQWYQWIQEGEFAGDGHYEEVEPPADVAFDAKSGIKFSNFGMG